MAKEDNFLCSLCLYPIWNGNTEEIGDNTKEIIDVVFVNRNMQLNKGQFVCQSCSKKLLNSFNFKCTCIYTEDFLTPFVSAVGGSQINLWEIFKRKHLKSDGGIASNQKVCRLCLQLIAGAAKSLLVQAEFDMIRKYMPEIMIHNTSDPVACEACIEHLHEFVAFIIMCVTASEKTNKWQDNKDTYVNKSRYKNVTKDLATDKRHLNLNVKDVDECREERLCVTINDINFYNPTEDIANAGHYYSRSSYPLPVSVPIPADDKDSIQVTTPTLQLSYEGQYKQETQDDDNKFSILYDLDLHMVKSEELDQKEQLETEMSDYKSKYRNSHKSKTYNCKHCDYNGKYLNALKSHMLNHADPSKIKFYRCKECDYKTKYQNALKSHMLNHADPSKIALYHCEECDYKTKYRNALKSHKLNHKSLSEIEMRECNQCPYKTKHRTALVTHMLKHKSPSEIQMYKCDQCKFQTKFKHALKPHRQKHKGDT